jgi:hypothetical protein
MSTRGGHRKHDKQPNARGCFCPLLRRIPNVRIERTRQLVVNCSNPFRNWDHRCQESAQRNNSLLATIRGLVLTQVGGRTRVSNGSADEGSPLSAQSKTKLPAPVQARSPPASPILTREEYPPDSQGVRGLDRLARVVAATAEERPEPNSPGLSFARKLLLSFREDPLLGY